MYVLESIVWQQITLLPLVRGFVFIFEYIVIISFVIISPYNIISAISSCDHILGSFS